jgi:predicted NUDIX family phosphoesterase/thymidylate kinase
LRVYFFNGSLKYISRRELEHKEMIDIEEKKKVIEKLEKKADSILSRMGERKRPVFIEFCGTPKAGKTTVVNSLDLFLRRNGYKVEVIRERASVCPISKKNHMHFNIWTSIMTLSNMLVLLDSSNDVVLIDRGIFDSMSWFCWMKNTGRLTQYEYEHIDKFICMDRWASLIDIIFILQVEYETAKEREFRDLLTLKPGSIMNERVISQYDDALLEVHNYFKDKFKHIYAINTTSIIPMEGARKVTEKTLEILESALDEKIFSIPHNIFEDNFGLSSFFIPDNLDRAMLKIKEQGKYIPRSKVEKSDEHIQIIPCGVIEFKGRVLLLKRKEIDKKNRLNEKYVIWAGGHVREDDASDETLITGLKRELAEELFIKSQYSISGPVGFVYFSSHIKSRKHMGIVYKVELSDDDVALGLDQTEFKERRGKSVSGTFQSPAELKGYYSGMEQWSRAILEKYYHIDVQESSAPSLFEK